MMLICLVWKWKSSSSPSSPCLISKLKSDYLNFRNSTFRTKTFFELSTFKSEFKIEQRYISQKIYIKRNKFEFEFKRAQQFFSLKKFF